MGNGGYGGNGFHTETRRNGDYGVGGSCRASRGVEVRIRRHKRALRASSACACGFSPQPVAGGSRRTTRSSFSARVSPLLRSFYEAAVRVKLAFVFCPLLSRRAPVSLLYALRWRAVSPAHDEKRGQAAPSPWRCSEASRNEPCSPGHLVAAPLKCLGRRRRHARDPVVAPVAPHRIQDASQPPG